MISHTQSAVMEAWLVDKSTVCHMFMSNTMKGTGVENIAHCMTSDTTDYTRFYPRLDFLFYYDDYYDQYYFDQSRYS